MSSQPIAALSGGALISGTYAYARYNSLPSLIASFGIGGVMFLSSMRIRDGMDYGLEGAVASSLAMVIPTARRAIMTRAPIPITMCLAALTSTGYYAKEWADRH